VGVTLTRPGDTSAEELIHQADVAMYQAKARGRSRCILFRPEMADQPLDRLERETSLRRGIERRELIVHYQPVVEANGGKVVGVEALVRWSSGGVIVPPLEFIPLAEETGLILPLGRHVLAEACRQVKAWQDGGLTAEPLLLSVNLSARQFLDEGLPGDVARILAETGLPPDQLCLEITESVLMADVSTTMSALQELKDLGVRLAIDDFGTGYSSLSYLKRFPVDVVKIDRSFVSDLGHHTVDSEIVGAVVRLAGRLGMSVVAEGVEDTTQLERLVRLGCPFIQGYLFSPPQPAERVEALISQGSLVAN
ncbi:MAG TPA: GGDEF domain-containing phosphodiesterase, partial [Acidimicrobiales bacterium]|nr:GGDEF domain-containing phosphodiesterase [Acidimicrobiales bacterium]